MSTSFYIVDDDKTVRKILEAIIIDNDLGAVIGTAEDGIAPLQEVPALAPDIVLIDLLLPGIDGISIVQSLKSDCPGTCFVMLSQVADKDMVAKAYQAGVDFFINKPINKIEVIAVIGQVRERMTMRNILQSLRNTIGGIEGSAARSSEKSEEETQRRQIKNILAKLGILGESGSEDIIAICTFLLNHPPKEDGPKKMNALYAMVAKRYADQGVRINAASVEQRIRRAIAAALNNTANLGLEDYSNEFFVTFGSSFFEFTEVRRQMNHIRGSSDVQGKISVKKFIEGLVMHIQDS